jgi:hypothetical protein
MVCRPFLSEKVKGGPGYLRGLRSFRRTRWQAMFAGHAGSREDQKKAGALVTLLPNWQRQVFRCKGDAHSPQACFQLLLERARANVMNPQASDRHRQD